MTLRSRKVILIGAPAAGKTSLAKRLRFNTFDGDYKSTIGVQLHEIALRVNDQQSLPMILWDTDGHFGESIFDAVYAKGAAAAVIVADVSRPETIEHMLHCAEQFERRFPARPSLCLLNKVDLRMPSAQTLQDLESCTDYVACCSALNGQGVLQSFTELAKRIVSRDAL